MSEDRRQPFLKRAQGKSADDRTFFEKLAVSIYGEDKPILPDLTLDEDFLYDDGEKQKRVWKIEKISNGKYSGSADDVVGYANGISSGNALNWAYELLLEVKGKKIKVKFDDWMFLHDRGVLINRAEISKFGINLGVVTITFIRI